MDKNKQQTIKSGLYIVSTPIGNMQDITQRAINVLKKSDMILCEDTRRSLKLLSFLEIKKKLFPYHKFNEEKVSKKVLEYINNNKIVSLIVDAGTPTISDPGMILVNKCINSNIDVFPIPGTSAVVAATSVSGFTNRYLFYGFLPKKEKELEKALKNLNIVDYSIVFFIPANKINFYLLKFKKYFLDRKILIAKEMTKIHEEYFRDDIKYINKLPSELKGELTVVLSEKNKEKNNNIEMNESVKMEINKMLKKYSHKDVVEYISKKENLPRKMVYKYCLNIKK